jgi:hypothetical protein
MANLLDTAQIRRLRAVLCLAESACQAEALAIDQQFPLDRGVAGSVAGNGPRSAQLGEFAR